MKHWFDRLYDAVTHWSGYIPERIMNAFERPRVVLKGEVVETLQFRSPRCVGYTEPMRITKGRSLAQRHAQKRRAFVQGLRRDA